MFTYRIGQKLLAVLKFFFFFILFSYRYRLLLLLLLKVKKEEKEIWILNLKIKNVILIWTDHLWHLIIMILKTMT